MKSINLFLVSLALAGFASEHTEPPKGLTSGDWSAIRAEYERHRHAAVPEGGGYRARNFAQQWITHFDGRGFTVEPDSKQWTWGLELERYGFAGHERVVAGRATANADLGRVSYQWGTALEEWFVNDGRGLEHGYTLTSRPEGAGGPLRIYFGVRGSLQPRVAADGRAVSFVDGADRAVVNYAGLKVWDADGQVLAARFEAVEGGLHLAVEEAGVRYPLTIDPVAQQAYLKASNIGISDGFGNSVAVSGDTAVVGAPGESSNATGVNGDQNNNSAAFAGAAYMFVRSGGVWSQQAYLKASNTGRGDRFGWSVGVSGETVVVGALFESSSATGVNGNQNNNAPNSGAAYMFVRSGGLWSQQAYLKASNTETNDNFGVSVAVSGETVVVGAFSEASNATGVNGDHTNNSAPFAGAAYVFVRSGGVWSQQAYLKASNTEAGDRFGVSVAVSGETVVVGAFSEASNAIGVNGDQTNNSALFAGAAYMFVRSGGVWSQQAYLKASNTEAGDRFGRPVAVSGDTVVVGAYLESSSATGVNGDQTNNNATDSGAAYVFARSGGVWSQLAYLKASNTGAGDAFGISVAVSEDTVIVGADGEDNSAPGSGAAYVFTLLPARNTTPQFSITQSVVTFSRATGRFNQMVTIANNGAALPMAAYVADSLPSGVAMVELSGTTTSATSPAGSPYKELGPIGAGATVTVIIEFTRTGAQAITYTPRVLGAGLW